MQIPKFICYFPLFYHRNNRLPFDLRNPLEFLIAVAIQLTMFSYAMLIGACTLSLAFGYYAISISESKCIKGSATAIARNSKLKGKRKHIFEQLIEFIEFHSHAKQLGSLFTFVCISFQKILKFWRFHQVVSKFFGNISSDFDVSVHVESGDNLWYFAHDANGNEIVTYCSFI